MRRKIKVLSLMLVMTLCLGLLSGCMATISKTTINEDGSGTLKMSVGFTKEFLDELEKMDSDVSEGILPEYKEFTYNGVTYYGEEETESFASVYEFNRLMSSFATDSIEDVENIRLSRDDNGNFTLVILGDTEVLKSKQGLSDEDIDAEFTNSLSPEELETFKEMADSMVIVFEFVFPRPIYQTKGYREGITINGNTLVLDITKMSDNYCLYEFSTDSNAKRLVTFTDVNSSAWYYNAVMAMADKGIVNGIGNNQFAPNGTLTYAEFCQILAGVKGLKRGGTTYWAEYAIQACLDEGYVIDMGTITPANWNKPISREAAIAGMYLAFKDELTVKYPNITADSIPDIKNVSSNMREEIIKAYQYGITTGVDGNRTFLPQNTLKRCEICQLFYNVENSK